MEYIGKYGEHRVLACLLERDVEAYQAIKINQAEYDLTVVLNPSRVVRIQVKSTELNNRSKNNSINVGEGFDFLVVVVFDGDGKAEFYVMSRCEALDAKGKNQKLSLSQKDGNSRNGNYRVTDAVAKHKDQWDKIQTHNNTIDSDV